MLAPERRPAVALLADDAATPGPDLHMSARLLLVDPDAFLPLGVAVRAATGVDPSIPDHWTWFARTRDGEENVGIRLGSPDPSEAEVAVWVPSHGRLRVVARGYSRFLHAALFAARRPYWR